MAAPTSYTETTLREYLHGRLGSLASVLGWNVADGSYNEAVNDVLLAYGTADITTVSGAANINLLRAYGRYFLWKSVAEATVNEIDYTHADSGATYKHSQIHKQAKDMMKLVADEIVALGGDVSGYEITAYEIEYTDDMYTALDASIDSANEWSRI
ncbi:MAG: hypothetical protein IT564_11590 [Rhodospirillales bacterium]|nr:hypothetical protein [Rhodospirillales bacterium]